MPWSEVTPMDTRLAFVTAAVCLQAQRAGGTAALTFRTLCATYGIEPKTGYKWLARYVAEGVAGLAERSRAPHTHPHATPAACVAALLALRQRYPHWGPKKLLAVLGRDPRWAAAALPARSTVAALLQRAGCVAPDRRRRTGPRPPTADGPPGYLPMDAPNAVWTLDFKGEFRTGDGHYCYPLTVVDGASRFLLACDGRRAISTRAVQQTCRRLFRTYGLPEALRSDNGPPFARYGLAGLSRLAVWWLRLGLTLERIRPGHPEENARHERLHRTLKAETTRPPAGSCAAQQQRFARWRTEYNTVRPHEALAQRPPASVYVPSARGYPERLPPLDYPAAATIRHVTTNGTLYWRRQLIFVSQALGGEDVGLVPYDDGLWRVYYGAQALAVLDERAAQLRPLVSPQSRLSVLPMSLD